MAPLGAGGMGEVWKARDTRLDRVVAIKRLKPQHTARFLQEARAIAALNHPHICQIYDVGPDYIVLEYVEGSPLRGPLKTEDVVRLAIQIASALEAAHQRGILHRDLKPGNVLISRSGAKLLDFGLAKMVAPSDPDATKTIDGTILGTAAYMSPEQAKSQTLDERSDVFSFGAVLYEMLSGTRAFSGASMVDILSSVLRDEPTPTNAPEALARIVTRCLRKAPTDRFQTMAEVKAALEQCLTKQAEPVASIAVLPFANLSADPENEYFSDGLAEEILNMLSQVEDLRVAARTSSFFFKGKAVEISEIAARLHVANVLEGSVRRAGDRVRVTVQLVEVSSGFRLWSERYDRQMQDLFDIQDQIARAVTERLKVTLSGGVKRSTENTEAYELYLKGRHYWHQRLPATLRLAIQCFEDAIKLDPRYALAYAGLADCYGTFQVYASMSPHDLRAPARAAVTQAMTLSPSLWEVNFSRGLYTGCFERAWREAEPYFQKAIAINPQSSLSRVYYSLILAAMGRGEEAVAQTTRACQIDPLSPFIHALTALALWILRRFDSAERMAQHALELQPGSLYGLLTHGMSLSGLGRYLEAVEAFERVVSAARVPTFVGLLGFASARAGRLDNATRLLQELEERRSRGEYVSAHSLLAIYVGQGDVLAIRRTLSQTIAAATPPMLVHVTSGPFLEAYRSDREIDQLLFDLYGR
jgi:TolB-like protein/tRNA A-37 threonylcarbamoyl transferase component Bud32/Tfp pilus assembly protein PilF